MATLTINQFREHLQELRGSGADDEQLAAVWHDIAQMLPDPSPETDRAHHRINAIAYDLGLAALTGQWWRAPTTLGRYHSDGPPEAIGIQWAEAYYRGFAMAIHVEGEPGNWIFQASSRDSADQEVFAQTREGIATLAEAYEAAMASQISAIDGTSD